MIRRHLYSIAGYDIYKNHCESLAISIIPSHPSISYNVFLRTIRPSFDVVFEMSPWLPWPDP